MEVSSPTFTNVYEVFPKLNGGVFSIICGTSNVIQYVTETLDGKTYFQEIIMNGS